MTDNAEQEIKQHLKKMDLDLRKSKFSRFTDQKVTPDVLSFIAECILNLPIDDKGWFVVKDIWDLEYFIKNSMAVFNKPSPTNESARHEYDKFIQQPLRMLYYSGILDSKKEGIRNKYKIINSKLLDYISIKERNAYLFLYYYLVKVLTDSGMIQYFEKFRKNNNKDNFILLKEKFIKFLKGNSNINQDVEIRRIFPKILNIYSVYHNIKGTKKGGISSNSYNFSDLMYNDVNFRDVSKDKAITRQEAMEIEIEEVKPDYSRYLIERAKNIIKRKYKESELKDKYSRSLAIHVHHIFPESEFPKIAHFLENLIKLTADQHLYHAHTKGNTRMINRDYQLICILAKSESIEKSLKSGEPLYTIPNFIFVINTGLNSELSQTLNLKQIRIEINRIYNFK